MKEVRIKPKAKAGASPLAALKAILGPIWVRLIGDSWRKKILTQVSALQILSMGGLLNGRKN